MRERAKAFIEAWAQENAGEGYDPDESKAAALAVQCAICANEAGIPDRELDDAGSLTAIMSAAMVRATDAARDKSKDN